MSEDKFVKFTLIDENNKIVSIKIYDYFDFNHPIFSIMWQISEEYQLFVRQLTASLTKELSVGSQALHLFFRQKLASYNLPKINQRLTNFEKGFINTFILKNRDNFFIEQGDFDAGTLKHSPGLLSIFFKQKVLLYSYILPIFLGAYNLACKDDLVEFDKLVKVIEHINEVISQQAESNFNHEYLLIHTELLNKLLFLFTSASVETDVQDEAKYIAFYRVMLEQYKKIDRGNIEELKKMNKHFADVYSVEDFSLAVDCKDNYSNEHLLVQAQLLNKLSILFNFAQHGDNLENKAEYLKIYQDLLKKYQQISPNDIDSYITLNKQFSDVDQLVAYPLNDEHIKNYDSQNLLLLKYIVFGLLVSIALGLVISSIVTASILTGTLPLLIFAACVFAAIIPLIPSILIFNQIMDVKEKEKKRTNFLSKNATFETIRQVYQKVLQEEVVRKIDMANISSEEEKDKEKVPEPKIEEDNSFVPTHSRGKGSSGTQAIPEVLIKNDRNTNVEMVAKHSNTEQKIDHKSCHDNKLSKTLVPEERLVSTALWVKDKTAAFKRSGKISLLSRSFDSFLSKIKANNENLDAELRTPTTTTTLHLTNEC